MELSGNWNYPTAVWFGVGRIARLADAARLAGMRNPLLVTDVNLATTPMLQQAFQLPKRIDLENPPTTM